MEPNMQKPVSRCRRRDVANVVHCPKRARQNSELYRRADELAKKRTLHVGNGLMY